MAKWRKIAFRNSIWNPIAAAVEDSVTSFACDRAILSRLIDRETEADNSIWLAMTSSFGNSCTY